MPSKTKIEWADYISNPIKARYESKQGHACVKISEGCAHCWASTFNMRLGTGLEYTVPNLKMVESYLDDQELMRLLTFKPRGPFKNGRDRALIFPFDMTDAFGNWIPPYWLERSFAIFNVRQDLDFLILTKRPDLMEAFLTSSFAGLQEPMKNIYLGASVENKARGEQRVGPMMRLHSMGWKTVVSYEPALGPVDWSEWDFIDGLICGGESGIGARIMHPDMARSARDFCVKNKIPFFFKQWGEWSPLSKIDERTTFKTKPVDMGGTLMFKVGKGMAGCSLDGREWKEMPGATG